MRRSAALRHASPCRPPALRAHALRLTRDTPALDVSCCHPLPARLRCAHSGLLLPEDLPDEVCAAALPTFRSRLVDPDAREPKKKTKKGKKGKKTAKGQGKGSAAKKPKSPGRKKSPRKR